MGTLTPEAGSVGRLLRVTLAESGLPGIQAVSVFPPGDVEGLSRSGKGRSKRHPFRLYPLCQNDMSRKQNHIPGQLQYSGVFRAFRRFGVLFPAMPNAESRAS